MPTPCPAGVCRRQRIFSLLQATHFDAAPHSHGAAQHCPRADGTALGACWPTSARSRKRVVFVLSCMRGAASRERSRRCCHGSSPGAPEPYSSGLDIAYVLLCAATMSGAWITQSYRSNAGGMDYTDDSGQRHPFVQEHERMPFFRWGAVLSRRAAHYGLRSFQQRGGACASQA